MSIIQHLFLRCFSARVFPQFPGRPGRLSRFQAVNTKGEAFCSAKYQWALRAQRVKQTAKMRALPSNSRRGRPGPRASWREGAGFPARRARAYGAARSRQGSGRAAIPPLTAAPRPSLPGTSYGSNRCMCIDMSSSYFARLTSGYFSRWGADGIQA